MKYFLLFAALMVVLDRLPAQEKFPILGETETNWPGIHYQIVFVQRLPPDRLLVGIRILATAKAAPGGTMIGIPVSIPPNANKYDIAAGYYHPLPLSLASSIMEEEATKQSYPALPPIAPPGKKYRPDAVLSFLRPGGSALMTIQFAVPPPPPPPPAGQPPVKQTVSFLFTNAKSPIEKIPVPPVDDASK